MRKFAVALSALFLVACVPCNLVACNYPFVLDITQMGGLPEGAYKLSLDIEGEHHELTCTVGEQMGPGACTPPVDDEGVFTVYPSVGTIDGTLQIRLAIVDTSDSEGSFLAHRGPEVVDVTIDYLDKQVAMESYTPEYIRLDDYRGAVECGYCDEMVQPQQLEIVVRP